MSIEEQPTEKIVREIELNISEPEKLINKCVILSKRAQKEENQEELRKSGAISLLVRIMKRYRKETLLLEKVLGALNNCSLDPANCSYLGQNTQIFELIIDLLTNYPKYDTEIISRVIGVIWNLSTSEENIQIFHKAKGLELFVKLLKEKSEVKEIQERGLGALTYLAVSDSISPLLPNLGVLEIIGDACTKFNTEDDLVLIERATICVFNLAAYEENTQMIFKSKIPSTIIELIKQFNDQNQIVLRCVGFFSNLTTTSEYYSVITEINLIAVFIQLLIKYKADLQIIRFVLNTILNLIQLSENKPSFVDNQGLEVLVMLMSEYEQLPIIQKKCCEILVYFASEEAYQDLFLTTKAISAIIIAMNTHPTDTVLLGNSAVCLSNLFFYENCKSQILDNQGILIFLQALKTNIKNRKFAERASLFLLNITCDKNGRELVLDYGGKKLCKQLLKTHKESKVLMKRMKATLTNMNVEL
ncbi:armadillo repeat-containing protein 4 armc4 [Anaeramoeba flamelloides]|uniref:Armadillo repeat-containing protein 4 armc4 n=1 Tax=Anaeramoeba flamelloides TaxID=1746091 RepID=A0AAV8AGC4_9EUKA|nr:armadillo repeat-containing protein 4 armc4 [Anaeramoeba flamelloides]